MPVICIFRTRLVTIFYSGSVWQLIRIKPDRVSNSCLLLFLGGGASIPCRCREIIIVCLSSRWYLVLIHGMRGRQCVWSEFKVKGSFKCAAKTAYSIGCLYFYRHLHQIFAGASRDYSTAYRVTLKWPWRLENVSNLKDWHRSTFYLYFSTESPVSF